MGNAGTGDDHRFTAPVDTFIPNTFGLHDMHGDIWEWCVDQYVPDSYSTAREIGPTGPSSGEARVQRGGGWPSPVKRCRSATRIGLSPSAYRGSYLGFRVVLEMPSAIDRRKLK